MTHKNILSILFEAPITLPVYDVTDKAKERETVEIKPEDIANIEKLMSSSSDESKKELLRQIVLFLRGASSSFILYDKEIEKLKKKFEEDKRRLQQQYKPNKSSELNLEKFKQLLDILGKTYDTSRSYILRLERIVVSFGDEKHQIYGDEKTVDHLVTIRRNYENANDVLNKVIAKLNFLINQASEKKDGKKADGRINAANLSKEINAILSAERQEKTPTLISRTATDSIPVESIAEAWSLSSLFNFIKNKLKTLLSFFKVFYLFKSKTDKNFKNVYTASENDVDKILKGMQSDADNMLNGIKQTTSALENKI